jgi:hypothetical protein
MSFFSGCGSGNGCCCGCKFGGINCLEEVLDIDDNEDGDKDDDDDGGGSGVTDASILWVAVSFALSRYRSHGIHRRNAVRQ